MNIHGLQKITLLDYPGKVACTVFLAGCNYRCPYCHNSELIDPDAEPIMSDDELLDFLKTRVGRLEGVAITGGEPLFTKETPLLIEKIKSLGYPVKLDTNGCFPDRLASLIKSGLIDYVAMDIKNSPERYAATAGLSTLNLEPVNRSVDLLKNGDCDYEFRTTVINEFHDEDSFYGIGKWIAGSRRYFLQPFTDRDTVLYEGFSTPLPEKMNKYAEIVRQFVDDVFIRGE